SYPDGNGRQRRKPESCNWNFERFEIKRPISTERSVVFYILGTYLRDDVFNFLESFTMVIF
ncbi:hypothetical protein P4V64_31165, partial [Bacillus thuringiensis]|nr:hypothetical protein [Bacillus thuringiensis]